MNLCSMKMLYLWTVLTGLLMGGSFFLAFWGIPRIIKSQVHKNTQLVNGTEQWDRFVELPFPINFTIRLFQVNNKNDVISKGALPNLTESHPYTYKLTLKKQNLVFNDFDEDSVTYTRVNSVEFDHSGPGKETDKVTIVNPLLMSALQIVSSIERLPLAGCLDKILGPSKMNELFITKTVQELLFDGIPFAFKNTSNMGYACEIVRQRMIERVKNVRVIEHINDDPNNDYLRLAIFNYKTTNYIKKSPDGIYTVNRGIKDMEALGTIMRWNGATHLSTYGTKESTNNNTCHSLRGTDSTIYQPMITGEGNVTIYNTDICRTVNLTFINSYETYKGIKAFRYETPNTFLRPSISVAEHDCYCAKETKDDTNKASCFLDGVLDFRPCVGVPLLVSQPHFLNADKKYLSGVIGLKPDKQKHGIHLLLEPNTGTPLQGRKRVQVNSVFRSEPFLSFLTPPTMHHGVIPILWIDETVDLPQKYVDQLNDQYFKVVKIATILKYVFIGIFSALFVGCLCLIFRKKCC
ncbi:sensory neuron membrane protein 2-like [Euwallacea fornicatus]|uniref:sensory neuron membrane protein 2-like n=1 Tax=Euwallacea fornicatus TaxID=995702 RepID=UPI003390040B